MSYDNLVENSIFSNQTYKDFNELNNLNIDQLISTVCMIAPFSIEEKQKLVETVKIDNKIKLLDEILNFKLLDFQENKTVQ